MNTTFFRVPMKPGGGMPTYQQQQPYPTAGVDVSARLSDSAAQIYLQTADQRAKGLEMLGQGMEQAAKAGYDIYKDYQTSQAREAFNQYRAEEAQQQANLSKLSGKDAIDPEKGVEASIAAWQQEARERLGKNLGGMARGMFDKATQMHGARFTSWGMEKKQAEQLTYMNQQDEGTIALDAQAMLADPTNATIVRNSLANIEGRYTAMRDRNKWSDEYAESQMNGLKEKVFGKMIQDQVNAGNVGAARTLLDDYGDRVGGNRGAFEALINAKDRELKTQARADAERDRAQQAISGVQNILSVTSGQPPEERRTAVLDEINKVQDIHTRTLMHHLAEGELAFQKTRAEAAVNAQAMDVARQTTDMGPVERSRFFVDNKTPETVIDAAQKIMSRPETPLVVMSEAKTMYDAGKSVNEISASLGTSFNPDGWAEFTEYTKSKELQKANRKGTALFNDMALQSGLDIHGPLASEKDKQLAADIKAEYDDMVASHEFKSLDDQKAWIFHKLVTVQKDRWYWNSANAPRELRERAGASGKVPDSLVAAIDRELNRRGIVATDAERQKMYDESLAIGGN